MRHDNDTIRFILENCTRHRLLSFEEEMELGRKKDEGKTEEERKQAFETLVKHNLRLVFYIAKRNTGRRMPLEDLFQEGFIGLCSAVQRFDYRMGNKFTTYAVWWIRQSINRAITSTGSEVRVPSHVHELRNKVAREISSIRNTGRKRATNKELSERIGASEDNVKIAIESFKTTNPVSLFSEKANKKDNQLPIDYYQDTEDSNTADSEVVLIAKDELRKSLKKITAFINLIENSKYISKRNILIFKKRMGLQNVPKTASLEEAVFNSDIWFETTTLSSIAKEYGLSRERVRQIEEKAWAVVGRRIGMNKKAFAHEVERIRILSKILAPLYDGVL